MNDTEIAVEGLDRIEIVARAIYAFDCQDHGLGKGDTMPPGEWNRRDHKPVPFHQAHPEIRRLYHGRAVAAMSA